jgi:DNA-binding response OmpR family regulator
MCYSLLMYLQDKFNVTTTTDIEIVQSLISGSGFDVILLDSEPSLQIEEICRTLKATRNNVPVILTYVYQNQIKDRDSKIRPYVSSVFYKPFDLNEVTRELSALAV